MKRPPSARRSPPKRRGRKKATTISVRSEKQISAIVTRFGLQGEILTFRDVCAALNKKYGLSLSVGTVWHIAHGQMPRDKRLRKVLRVARPAKPRIRYKTLFCFVWAAWLGTKGRDNVCR